MKLRDTNKINHKEKIIINNYKFQHSLVFQIINSVIIVKHKYVRKCLILQHVSTFLIGHHKAKPGSIPSGVSGVFIDIKILPIALWPWSRPIL